MARLARMVATGFPHLLAAVRYVERNPLRSGLVERPDQWRWSSAAAHLNGRDDALVSVSPMLELVSDWAAYLALDDDVALVNALRRHERTGRPLGDEQFLQRLERLLGHRVAAGKRGRKPKVK